MNEEIGNAALAPDARTRWGRVRFGGGRLRASSRRGWHRHCHHDGLGVHRPGLGADR